MGLDITHYKATLKKPLIDSFNFVLENEFNGFDVPFDYFQNYIQKVYVPEVLEIIIIPRNENDIDELKQLYKDRNCHFIFEKDYKSILASIDKFLKYKNLDKKLIKPWQAHKWMGIDIYEYKKETGFYFSEIGYQRKGVNENFWERFNSNTTFCFTTKEDFDFAYSCVDFYWDIDTKEDIEMRKKLFKENFVDKYELNRSWMNVSY